MTGAEGRKRYSYLGTRIVDAIADDIVRQMNFQASRNVRVTAVQEMLSLRIGGGKKGLI